VSDEVIARPRQSFWCEPRAFHADHVRQEVTPCRLPQRGAHAALIDFMSVATAGDAREHRGDVCTGQSECSAEALAVRLLIKRHVDSAGLRREAALVAGVLGAITRALGRRVVRRRAEAQELQAVRIVLRVELFAELLRALIRRRARVHPEHEQAFDAPGEIRGGERDAQPHACRFRLVEIHHPAHARIDRGLVGGNLGRGIRIDLRIRTDSEIWPDVAAGSRGNDASSRLHNRDPSARQQPGLRRAPPGRIFTFFHDIYARKARFG
jgi:hypothetical protein